MRTVVFDTWAFLERALDGPRSATVQALAREVDVAVTVRDAVVETFNHLVKRTGRFEAAWDWWADLRESPIAILEPSLEEVRAFMAQRRKPGRLSFVDYAVAWACEEERTREVATEDHEFRSLGLLPLFARR